MNAWKVQNVHPLAIYDKLAEFNFRWAEIFAHWYNTREGYLGDLSIIAEFNLEQVIFKSREFYLYMDQHGIVEIYLFSLKQHYDLLTPEEDETWNKAMQ